MAATPLLEISGIDKSFGPVQVLHDVSLSVYPGEVTALVGDNGAGKSTLVKCVSGIYAADAGTITFEGNPVAITKANVKDVIADGFVTKDQICTADFAKACTAAGIS